MVGSRASKQLGQGPAMDLIRVGAAGLEVLDEGSGEPIVFIQTALTADELFPVADQLRDRFRTIVYHRRGYGNSTPIAGPGSISLDAADCSTLLEA
ncbi:hypothetical protein AC20117_05035 [Arthrobacter crystallopoietes]|nr:hypothetical protein AC20117_05035 [Arthrobacter crystallopoietes]